VEQNLLGFIGRNDFDDEYSTAPSEQLARQRYRPAKRRSKLHSLLEHQLDFSADFVGFSADCGKRHPPENRQNVGDVGFARFL
jgi:hypothetical protein